MGVLTPASQSAINFYDVFTSANFYLSPSTITNISASILMKQSWPKGPYGDSTYPYTGWGTSGSYNYANRLCGTPSQPTAQSLGKFFDKQGTCTDSNAFPYYGVRYTLEKIFGDSSDTINNITCSIKDSSLGTILVSNSQSALIGPTEFIPSSNPSEFIILSTEATPNVQNCYWTLDFDCNYRTSGTGRVLGFCDANDGNGLVNIFDIAIADGNTYNLSYTTDGYAPTASLTGSGGGGFIWEFQFN
jgi:hypothetical protein